MFFVRGSATTNKNKRKTTQRPETDRRKKQRTTNKSYTRLKEDKMRENALSRTVVVVFGGGE